MSKRIRIPGKLPSVKFPLHYEGAPPRRLYFPEWYVTLAEPKEKMPKNYARFHVPADMTKYDVKEYLVKIYGLNILNLRLSVVNYVRYKSPLPWKGGQHFEWKFLDPWKIAHVFLANEEMFEYPDPLKNKDDEEDEKTFIEKLEMQQNALKSQKPNKHLGDKSKIYLDNDWF